MNDRKKKVMIRFETASKARSKALVAHDFRNRKPNYLRTNMYHNKFSNNYFNYDSKLVNEKIDKSYDEYNSIYKAKNKRNLRVNKNSDFLTAVIIVSNIVNDYLEQQKVSTEELKKCFENAVSRVEDKIESILGQRLELFYYVLHYDEKTPHLHCSFSNHTKSGNAAFHTIKNTGRLSEFQDVVAECFSTIGLERGERKSKAKHLKIVDMHKAEIKDLKTEIKTIQATKREIKASSEKSNAAKKSELDILDEEMRTIRSNIKELQSREKILEEKKIENANQLQKQITEDTNRIIQSNKDELEDVVKETLEDYSRSDFIWAKENTYESLLIQNDSLIQEVNELEKHINSITIIEEDDLMKIEEEAKVLFDLVYSQKTKALTLAHFEKESIKKKKKLFGTEEEFDHKYYISQSKNREEHLLEIIRKQNIFIKIILEVFKQIASFYKKIVTSKNEDEIKNNSTEIKNNIKKSFWDEDTFSQNSVQDEGTTYRRLNI